MLCVAAGSLVDSPLAEMPVESNAGDMSGAEMGPWMGDLAQFGGVYLIEN